MRTRRHRQYVFREEVHPTSGPDHCQSQSKRGSGSYNDFAPDPPEYLIPEPRGEISTADGSRNLIPNLRGSDREALPFLLLWREKWKSSITALRLWRRQGRRRCCGCGDAVGGGRGFFLADKSAHGVEEG